MKHFHRIFEQFCLQQIILSSYILAFAGCSGFGRSADSGYGEYSERGPKIIKVQKPMDDVSISEKVQDLERTLTSQKELEQYSKVLPYLDSMNERLEFLSQPTIEDRSRWATSKNIWGRAQENQKTLRKIMESQDISLGMNTHLVRKAWGEPLAIEVSGNPYLQNERWKYQRFAPTPTGFRKEHRYVYFEGGKVVGWETE